MITKIVFTAAVVLFVLLLFNKSRWTKSKAPQAPASSKILERSLYLFLTISLTIGATLYYLDWRDENSTLVVTITNPNSNETKTYEIVKGSLGNRSFKTVEGEFVSLSSIEHMEIKKK